MQAHAQELDELPAVAREAIRAQLEGRPAMPGANARGALAIPAPVFVTLWQDDELRGCIGELEARHGDLVAETSDRAVAAAFHDSRFPPLSRDDLRRCRIEVTVLGPIEKAESEEALDPSRFGIEVTDGEGRRAVLLPGIEGIDTVQQQLVQVRRKAGIPLSAGINIRRFEVIRIPEAGGHGS